MATKSNYKDKALPDPIDANGTMPDDLAGGPQLKDIQRALINILDDFDMEKKQLEQNQKATLNILEDFDIEKTKVEKTNLMLQDEIGERKRAEEKAMAERQRFNEVLDVLPVYIVLLAPDYHVPFANRFFRQRFGESYGKCCFEYLFGRTEPCELCETFTVFKTKKPHHWEWLGPDHRNYDVYDFPFVDSDGSNLILEMGIDITEKKKAEAALQKAHDELEARVQERTAELERSNIQLRAEMETRRKAEEDARELAKEWKTTFDSIADLVSIQDNDFRLVRVNRAYEETVKMKQEELVGKRCYEVIHGSSCPVGSCPHQQTITTKKSCRLELYEPRLGVYLEASTSPIINETGEVIGTVHIAKDITERKQAEEDLLKEKAFSETAINSMPGVFYLFKGDGKFLRWNRNFEDITGYSSEEFKRLSPLDLFEGDDRNLIVSRIAQVFREGSANAEANLVCKNGKKVPYYFTGFRMVIAEVPYLIGSGIDIAERKRAEEDIKNLNESLTQHTRELEASNKELESFSYSVSHDLRAPLRSMDGFSLALMEDYGDKLDSQAKEYLRYIRSSSQLMGQLIDDILNLSRITRVEIYLDKVDLSELANEVAGELKRIQPERKVDFVIAPGLEAYGDRSLLKLVFQNLLGNAFKFTQKQPVARIEFGGTNCGEMTYFVRDNGVGFDMTYASKLFKPFQRLHRPEEFSGTGIGLASVQRIISRLGGKVWAEGQVGRGAVFYFTLGQL